MKDRFKGLNGDLFDQTSDIELPASRSPKAPTTADIESEASAALIALGYKPQEAAKMISRVATPGADSETLIKEALRAAI